MVGIKPIKNKKIIIRKICYTLLIGSIGFIALISNYMLPSMNANPKKSIANCILSSTHTTATINSMNQLFNALYVENAGRDCTNPYFPAINITTKAEHNAWLQVVYTDSQDYKWQHFIDAADPKKYPTIHPFYTLEQNFYDAPFWWYTLFSRPISFWKGHAYAVQVDHQHKTIKVVGGVEWGYKLSYFHLYPKIIEPTSLNQEAWEQDWQIFKTVFDGYRNL
jgi:hypothetical protein